MKNKFDSNIFFNNLSFLIKRKGLKIGELETSSGVSAGYIARMSKEDNSKPGIDFIVSAASYLEVGLDTLLKTDLENLSPTELYLIKFFEKLKKDTLNDKIRWKKDTADNLNFFEPEFEYDSIHPLMEYEKFEEFDSDNQQVEVRRYVMKSDTYGTDTRINGDCFSLSMTQRTFLYVMNISDSYSNPNDEGEYAIEIWMCQKDEEELLATNTKKSNLAYLVDDLYSVLMDRSKLPQLKEEMKEAIEAYLNSDELEDKENPSFDIDINELPF